MKRFAASVMTVLVALCLTSPGLLAHAVPGNVPLGDHMSPEDGGAAAGGGDGAGSGGSDDGAPSNDPGPAGGPGEPAAAPPGVSVPRVMLAGFTSTPAEVKAGEDFTVSFTLRNTSKRTRVQNIKVSLSSGEGAAFLPANGSSSIFIERISAGDDSIQSMAFHSLASLEERPYQLTLGVEYEDAAANAYQSQETVSVPVKQTVRADTSAPQVMPEMVQAGQDASVTFNIHNQGRTKLYNAKAVVKKGQHVAGEDVFIGTIEPGSSGAVDMLVHADQESTDPLVIDISYEDVDGKVTSLSKEVPLSVMPAEVMEEGYPGDEMPMEESTGVPWVATVIALLVLLLVAVALVLVRRSRRRSREREDMESLAMMDDDPLVPTDHPQA